MASIPSEGGGVPRGTGARGAGAPRARSGKLPVIEINNRQLSAKRDDTISAVAEGNWPARLFHGDEGLVMVGEDKKGDPIIRKATREHVQDVMADSARWISTRKFKQKDGSFTESVSEVIPPRDLAENYMVQSAWPGVPPIDGIVTAPIVAPDGTFCLTNGYHESARVFLSLPEGFELMDTTPTPENVEGAKRLILKKLFGDVMFVDDSSRCHALCLMILPFVRLLINGPTPLHLIDAPTQSSGKSWAAKICISPFSTPRASMMKGDDEEWRKAILSALLSGRSHMWLDNVKGQLSSPTLAAALTEPTLTERAMGGLREISASVRCVWVATSNNARLDADTASRCVVIRLDTGEENPEGRVFKLEPISYIQANRSMVVTAIFTLIRNWQEQGSPHYSGKSQSRFNQWQAVMGGIMEANNVPGFLKNLATYRATLDPEKAAWGAFMEAWYERYSDVQVCAGDLKDIAMEIPEIAGALGDAKSGDAGGRSQVLRLGKLLQSRRDKVFSKWKICPGLPNRNGATYHAYLRDDPRATRPAYELEADQEQMSF